MVGVKVFLDQYLRTEIPLKYKTCSVLDVYK